MHEKHIKQEEGQAHSKGKQGDLLRQAIKLALKWALSFIHILREISYLAELSIHPYFGNHGPTIALRHRSPSKNEVWRFSRCDVLL